MLQFYLDIMGTVFEGVGSTDVVSFTLSSCKTHM